MTDGLLEAYLLGVLSEAEREEARQLFATDPDVMAQLDELELAMEAHFLESAVPPPPSVGLALQERLFGSELKKWEPETTQAPPPPEPEPSRSPYIDVEVSDTYLRVHKYWRAAFIAVFVLSKIFLVFGLYQYFKANSLEQEILRLKASQQTVAPSKAP
ncbi:hypothetical protein FAES_4623 [Fibrella aestuarina BUZ 2]|uniref:Uncharacterized protein n=2 Tax=Fibrella TaxID=861914 RepID=I0KER9_9BACT|nr:hypothetical protein FAES_4623 [Fibrella aestuarina BUZ 2]